jgi:hypothetical protein
MVGSLNTHVKSEQNILEITNASDFLTLFNNKESVRLFKYGKLRTLVSMITLLILVTVIKQ